MRLDPHRVAQWNLWGNVALTVFWSVMLPVALTTGLKDSVPFLVLISIWALVASHLAGAIAAFTARRAEED